MVLWGFKLLMDVSCQPVQSQPSVSGCELSNAHWRSLVSWRDTNFSLSSEIEGVGGEEFHNGSAICLQQTQCQNFVLKNVAGVAESCG